MKAFCKFATLTLMLFAVSVFAFSATKPLNLVRGIVGPVSANTNWANYSVLSLVPGAALIPVTSSTTAFYLGFTAGTEVDISNMVLYTTARGSSTITAVTPVKYGGSSSPSINLATTTVCPIQEISVNNPCIVRLDPVTLTLSALSDYYLVIYFTNDSNNGAIGATQPSFSQSSLMGWYVGTTDETRLTVGESIPTGNSGHQPYFLMYVMTD